MFKKDFVAQLKAAFEKCSKQTLKHKLADMAGSVKSEGGEGVKVNNKKKKQKKKKWNDDWSFRMNFERSKW